MMTMLPVPMNRPPSSVCQNGAGNWEMSTSSPLCLFWSTGPSSTCSGGTGSKSLSRLRHSSTNCLRVRSTGRPRLRQTLGNEVRTLAMSLYPSGYPFIFSNSSAGFSISH